MTQKNPIFCAVDTTDLGKAKSLIRSISPYVGGIKLGLEFFTHHGAEGVKRVIPEGIPLFLDLKFHDIPNTVAGAVRALRGLNIFMFTLHASGGAEMMKAAMEAAQTLPTKPKVLGVTILTSLDTPDMEQIGYKYDAGSQALVLARLAKSVQIDGVVCSAYESASIRSEWSNGVLVVPGIRPAGSASGDQKRIMTPKQAMDAGANYLVIGRPITEALDPAKAAADINMLC